MKHLPSRKLLTFAVVLGAVAAAAMLANAGRAGQSARRATAGAVVHLRKTGLGSILADARGRTLYLFEKDTSTASTCNSECASYWPPLKSHGTPHAAAGVHALLLGLAHGQVTYAGHPLYRFVGDKRAGQTTGEGLTNFGADWYVVAANGKKIEPAKGASSSSGSGTQTGGGYGYGVNRSASGW